MWESPLVSEDHTDSFVLDGSALRTCWSRAAEPRCAPVALSCLSALSLLLSWVVLVRQRCRYEVEVEGPGRLGALISLYRLLGNLCASTGAVLSRQLQIQVVLSAFAASLDGVAFLSYCVPLCLRWNSEEGRRLRMRRRRRRQYVLSVSVLMVLGGGFLKAGVGPSPVDMSLPVQRRLLCVSLDARSDILGYILGVLSFLIACSSRFPALRRASQGHVLPGAQVVSVALRSLAAAFYAAAILLSDSRRAFLLRAMPWVLSAMSCVILDLLLGLINLLSLSSASGITIEGNPPIHNPRKEEVHSTAQTKMNPALKGTELGRYLDVIVQPDTKICLKEVTVSKRTETEGRCESRLIRVDSFYSDTSSDSSTVGSDLEWDFEEVYVRWSEPALKPPDRTDHLPTNSLRPLKI